MTPEERALNELLISSLHFNSNVLEIATFFIGNMSDKRNVAKARKAFTGARDKFLESYDKTMEQFSDDNQRDTPSS